ncbi:MAG: UDP-N-acetylmuramoyl-L-alanine--D-glutamate ligase [Armatimonadetes bacterium]|nr:UDP-N-acetylmuramoyl-L-alanine--D-glutamate ligase [Armatimonadota bacterium]
MTLATNPRVPKPLELKDRDVLVVGAGVSGVAAARVAAILGARVALADRKPIEDFPENARSLPSDGVLLLGDIETWTAARTPDLAVLSPGIPPTAPIFRSLQERGVPIVSELELAWQFCPARIAAVTGTNGKGTTCRLLHGMLSAAGLPTVLAGNIGRPLAECLFELTPEHTVVLEVSSFQLYTTRTFAPQVAACLNITPDHLDWHRDLDEYVEAKGRIFARQWPDDLALLVVDDPGAAALETRVVARLGKVSLRRQTEITWRDDCVVARLPGRAETIVEASAVAGWGEYHKLDAMVAAGAALWLGAPAEAISLALATYEHPPHLMTLVAEEQGVRYVDDSKATNVAAAVADLEHLRREGPVVVITGGKDKGTDLCSWAEAIGRQARAAVLIGETAARLAELISGVPVSRAKSLDEAVQAARRLARAGDTVALIPAASSFDMFSDYADRGKKFAEAVARTGKNH